MSPPNPGAPARTYLDAWHEMLDADPDDFATRALMADWYADRGDTAAEDCLRWQARERKRPYWMGNTPYHWYDQVDIDGNAIDPGSDLPSALFRRLRGGKRLSAVRRRIYYPTRRAAEEALLAAWRELAARGQAPGSARLTGREGAEG